MEPNPSLYLGWSPDLESQHSSDIAALSLADGSLPCSSLAPSDTPLNLDPSWFIQKNQGCWPFCHAHMRNGIVRLLYWLTTKGKQEEFSRYYAAITDLRMDGNDSEPAGASIGGSLKASIKYGEALEAEMPYPPLWPNPPVNGPDATDAWCRRNYTNKLPESATQDSMSRHIQSIVPNIRTYKDLDAALTSGRTAVGFGMNWTTGWAGVRSVDTVKYFPSGRVLGGHALLFFGWRTILGRRYPIMHNSHDGWGINRRAAIAPEVCDQILSQSQFGAFAVTNIAIEEKDAAQAQPWDWLTVETLKAKPIDPFS